MRFAFVLSSFLAAAVSMAVTCAISAAGVTVTSSSVEGIGEEEGVMRRDPSDIIKVKDLYYVWYSKGALTHGYGQGVVAQIGGIGTEEVRNTFQYAGDGLTFSKMMKAPGGFPTGAGTYRPEAFTDSDKGQMIEWGLEIRGKKGCLAISGPL